MALFECPEHCPSGLSVWPMKNKHITHRSSASNGLSYQRRMARQSCTAGKHQLISNTALFALLGGCCKLTGRGTQAARRCVPVALTLRHLTQLRALHRAPCPVNGMQGASSCRMRKGTHSGLSQGVMAVARPQQQRLSCEHTELVCDYRHTQAMYVPQAIQLRLQVLSCMQQDSQCK